jgi:hypothetical protein
MGDRQKDKIAGPDGKGKTFLLRNDGSKTLFDEESPSASRPAEIREFDKFQENLLRNYGLYRDALRPRGQETFLSGH